MSEELEEVWLPIAGYEGRYEVSNLGRVRSYVVLGPAHPPRILKGATARNGYLQVTLCGAGRRPWATYAHALVATAFHGPRPDGMDCRHLDGDKTNNAASNLAWGTKSENAQDKNRHGTSGLGRRQEACKQGHPYVVTTGSYRYCRTCNRLAARRRAVRLREAAGLTPVRPADSRFIDLTSEVPDPLDSPHRRVPPPRPMRSHP